MLPKLYADTTSQGRALSASWDTFDITLVLRWRDSTFEGERTGLEIATNRGMWFIRFCSDPSSKEITL